MFEFGPFRLDLRARQLSKGGEPLPLAPKSFDLLAYLVLHAGRAVSREELFTAVWPDVVVSDGSLTQAVFVVRRALGETEEGSRFVQTVPKTGYRFSGDVRAVERGDLPARPATDEVGSAADAADAARRRVRRGAVAVALLALSLAAVRWVSSREKTPAPAAARLLTVLREIPAPPDATALLGVAGRSAVLGAPSAIYLLPLDGAQAATRVGRDAGEVAADRLVGAEIVVAAGRDVAARDVLTAKTRRLGSLPPDAAEARDGRFLVSPSGAFLALRAPGSVDVFAAGGGGLSLAFRVPAPESPNEALALSDRWLAFAPGSGGGVRAYELATGRKVLDAPFAETRVRALALEDATGRLAVGGAFDSVSVFPLDGGPAATFPARGWTRGLAWVADHPTLLASGRLGLAAWRPGEGVVAAAGESLNGSPVVATPEGVVVLSPERQRLAVLAYGGLAPVARVAVSSAPIWALACDREGKTLFAGGRDGKLHAVDVASRRARSEAVHTDGIPSLLATGDLLASASDDKTVAVWRLPGPKLVLRTRAHDFLVNDLQIAPGAPGGAVLVTSSSDGTVKTWSWPSLAPLETIDLAPFAGGKVEAHAVWTAPDASRILVGTWNHALLDLTKAGGRWSGRRIATESRAVYRLAGLAPLGLVAGVGISPHEVFLLDLATGRRRVLEDGGLDAYWAVAETGGDAFVTVGDGGVARFSLARAADGAVSVSVVSRRGSGLPLLTAALLPDGRLWAGANDGAVLGFPREALRGAPFAARTLHFSTKSD